MEYKVITDLAYTYIGLVTTMTKHYVSEGVPLIFNSSIKKEGIDVSKPVFLDIEFAEKNKNRKHKKNDVVTVHTGDIGVSAVISDDLDGSLGFATIVTRINDHDVLLPEYLCAFLNYGGGKEQLYKYSRDARNNLNLADYNRLIVPLPSINKQYEIIELEKILKNIIDYRKQQLQQLDDLVKARFVELFGDCANTVRLGDCCEVHARIGWQALTKNEHMKTGEYMLVTGTDFKDGEIDYSTCVYVAKERFEMDKHIILKNDDVLITKDGTIGKVAIVHNLCKPATLNAGVFVVRPDERFNKEYIANVFKGPLFSDYVEASKTGATIKHLNQKHLVEFMIPVPSLAEQETFAQFTKQIDKSKFYVANYINKIHLIKGELL